jgi:2-amino-4-hydroxy-6-hydroxymethyldihydropteridine diphosphokinase
VNGSTPGGRPFPGRGDGLPGHGRPPERPAPPISRAYLALGANQGTPILNLKRAVEMLSAESGIKILARSSIYQTLPLGEPGQPNYFNAVIAVDTTMEPRRLLRRCQAVETALGRVRTGAVWAPRTIDIDILLYGDKMIVDGHLSVPHPRIGERDFVVVPLIEIAPDAAYPGGHPVVLSSQAEQTILRKLEGAWD